MRRRSVMALTIEIVRTSCSPTMAFTESSTSSVVAEGWTITVSYRSGGGLPASISRDLVGDPLLLVRS